MRGRVPHQQHREKAQHAMEKEGAINCYLYIASPEMGNVNLKQWQGGCPGRIERQRGSITIKLSAGKNALEETGLSLWICMNWKGETA